MPLREPKSLLDGKLKVHQDDVFSPNRFQEGIHLSLPSTHLLKDPIAQGCMRAIIRRVALGSLLN